MPRAVFCDIDGTDTGVEEALRLRDDANSQGQPPPDFRCTACGAPVRPHREGGAAAAHFEHLERNPDCQLSDPLRETGRVATGKNDRPRSEHLRSTVGDSLLGAALQAGGAEMATDLAEIGLDSILDESVLCEVPVLGSVVRAVRAVGAIRERLFLRKVALFLSQASEVSHEQRAAFGRQLADDPGLRREVGEALMLLLERHEDLRKAALLGRIFAEFVRGSLSYSDFRGLAWALDACMVEHLDDLKRCASDLPSLDYEVAGQLTRAGLLRAQDYTASTFKHNRMGRKLLGVLRTDSHQ